MTDLSAKDKKNNTKYSVFGLGKYKFGIEMSVVREVLTPPKVTIIPNVAAQVLGVFNLRGKIIGLVDIKQVLGMSTLDKRDSNMILLVSSQEEHVGFLVEQVYDFIEVDQSKIVPADKDIPEKLARYLTGKFHMNVTGDVYLLKTDLILNPDSIFKELNQ